ncbi:glycoside hydrolase family 10 protein [Oleiharenicola lentus]|uniref:glycoside hydrolase family 10 protein n=1 Tax=Oleiharenicola lentus TaxID=2508720 RepID=UPI003F67C65D
MKRIEVGPDLRAGRLDAQTLTARPEVGPYHRKISSVILGLISLFIASCASDKKPATKSAAAIDAPVAPAPKTIPAVSNTPPAAPREFRAMWIATVKNIDWPSLPGLPVEQQRTEMNAILDRAVALKLNAVIFQIRPSADALYQSKLEPWSEYLTGVQGKDPGYDPLEEWVSGAHRRGLELHAWFNPYRARHAEAKSANAASHIARTHPNSVKSYGGYQWMDPGDDFARERTLAVVRDVVQRYDLDGVHIDDYFYPYPVADPKSPAGVTPARELDFPDTPSWNRYVAARGKLNRADWRRDNVDRLVEEMNRTVHKTKPWVKFGVSPFGLGRPDRRPPGITGFSQYDKLYADVELWLAKGWLDYLVPQLYWPRDRKGQEYAVLLDYWLRQPNPGNRYVWPGLNVSGINDTEKSWPAEEIIRQVDLTRTRPAANGHVHYSAIALMQNRKGVTSRLQQEMYLQPALIPAMPWLSIAKPEAPKIASSESVLQLTPARDKNLALHAVWRRYGPRWVFSTQPASFNRVTLTPHIEYGAIDAVVISAVDRFGNESERVTWTKSKR